MRRSHESARGAAAAEFVLVLPVLLMVVLGAIDWGWYFSVREVAINAAREGARSAALLGNGSAEGAARANAYLAQAGVCPGGATAAVAGAISGNPVMRVVVTCTNVVLTNFFPATVVPRTLTVSAEMRHE